MKTKLTISIDPEVAKKVSKLADKKHRTFSAMVNAMLHQMLDLPEFMGGYNISKGQNLKEDMRENKI